MRLGFVFLSVLVCGYVQAQEKPALAVWPVDPLVKVFPDAVAEKGGEAPCEVARGESAVFQVVVRSSGTVKGLRAKMEALKLEGAEGRALPVASIRFVGFVPVDRPMQAPPRDRLREPPADYPDPLLESESVDVRKDTAQPVWVTIPVPVDAAPGMYSGQITISGQGEAGPVSAELPLRMRVYPVTVAQSRLWVTNWFQMGRFSAEYKGKTDSPEYWELLRRYARNMAAHRQNVALISPLHLAEYKAGADGKLEIDFGRFDRWVEIFKAEGVIGRIEGGHLGGRAGDWESAFVVHIRRIKDGKVESAEVPPDTAEADGFYARFFPALADHLRQKGWFDIYTQHLADEPIGSNIASYRAIAALVRKYAPGFKIIEACHTKDLTGSMDIWVPQLNYYHNDYKHYRERQKAGEEVWFYTCVFPQGEYANRFIEQSLIKTRLLHWINFRYGATGYLHWGYNQWTEEDPFTRTTRAHGGPPYLPAGDPWIVYPGKDGPLDSIRFEAMRDGIADYELLSKLAERDRDAAMKLASKHILGFDKYDGDVARFRETRRELLKALSE